MTFFLVGSGELPQARSCAASARRRRVRGGTGNPAARRQVHRMAQRFAQAAAKLVHFLFQFDHAQLAAHAGAVEAREFLVPRAQFLCLLSQRIPVRLRSRAYRAARTSRCPWTCPLTR